jgi:hypothetical protein
MEYFISRAFAARGAHTRKCTHAYVHTHERASEPAGVFCNNHVDFCFTERGGSRNRIRMNFVPARSTCRCFAYSIVVSVLTNLKLKRAHALARSSCFGFQRGKRLDGDPF